MSDKTVLNFLVYTCSAYMAIFRVTTLNITWRSSKLTIHLLQNNIPAKLLMSTYIGVKYSSIFWYQRFKYWMCLSVYCYV